MGKENRRVEEKFNLWEDVRGEVVRKRRADGVTGKLRSEKSRKSFAYNQQKLQQ